MCGIIGYAGRRDPAKILLDGLKKLEYRGYDSAGIALAGKDGVKIYKDRGKVANLEQKIAGQSEKGACLGLGHTRWATHGKPSIKNAHPHCRGNVTLVHNGIVENEAYLRKSLIDQGFQPISDTDTELIAILLDHHYSGDPVEAIRRTLSCLEGSYALGILFRDQPDKLFALRKDSPLVIGRGKSENFIASDLPAILGYTREYWLPEEGELAILSAEGVTFLDARNRPIKKPLLTADQDEKIAQKEGYPHFMAKEIAEQPRALRETLCRYYKDGGFSAELPDLSAIRGRIWIIGCGSAYHAGLLGKHALERLARLPVTVEIASEFRYGNPILSEKDLVIAISQSGETADTLAALRLARKQGISTLGIVNVWGSTLSREADAVLYTAAGPEISVATTKAYTCQTALLFLLALKSAEKNLSPAAYTDYCRELERLPEYVARALEQEHFCRELAMKYCDAEHLFFIGRGQDHSLTLEASLKLKEITYIHSEAYAAGELKHGTISLIEEGTPVVAVCTDRRFFSKTAGNIREVRARGARVLCIAPLGTEAEGIADDFLPLPPCPELPAPIPAAVLTQLFAYHTAVARGNDVDQPRNLAKSVTVE